MASSTYAFNFQMFTLEITYVLLNPLFWTVSELTHGRIFYDFTSVQRWWYIVRWRSKSGSNPKWDCAVVQQVEFPKRNTLRQLVGLTLILKVQNTTIPSNFDGAPSDERHIPNTTLESRYFRLSRLEKSRYLTKKCEHVIWGITVSLLY